MSEERHSVGCVRSDTTPATLGTGRVVAALSRCSLTRSNRGVRAVGQGCLLAEFGVCSVPFLSQSSPRDSSRADCALSPSVAAVYTPVFSPPASSKFLYPTYESLGRASRAKATSSSSGSRQQAYFACPSSGGRVLIPWEMINDGFCDCRSDGADEPGTDACGGLVPLHSRAAERLRASVHAASQRRSMSSRGEAGTVRHTGAGPENAEEDAATELPAGPDGRTEAKPPLEGAPEGAAADKGKDENKRDEETLANSIDSRSFVELADGRTDIESVCKGFPGDCGDKKFRRLKGGFGYFCGSADGKGRPAGKPRVISPLKVHDGICGQSRLKSLLSLHVRP